MPVLFVHEDPHGRPDTHLPGVPLAHLIMHIEWPDAIYPVAALPGRPHLDAVASGIGECLPNTGLGIRPTGKADRVHPLRRRGWGAGNPSSPMLKGLGPRSARLSNDRVANHGRGPSEPSGRLSRSAVQVKADNRTPRRQTFRF